MQEISRLRQRSERARGVERFKERQTRGKERMRFDVADVSFDCIDRSLESPRSLFTLTSLSPPPVASRPDGWKSSENTGCFECQTTWSVLAFIVRGVHAEEGSEKKKRKSVQGEELVNAYNQTERVSISLFFVVLSLALACSLALPAPLARSFSRAGKRLQRWASTTCEVRVCCCCRRSMQRERFCFDAIVSRLSSFSSTSTAK
jgi:hypothetical protein